MAGGFVYILSNPAMPGLLKIGGTARHGAIRARELSDKTGVAAPFRLEWQHPVTDWQAIEALTHSRLTACRPNGSREFFACSVAFARAAIEREARDYLRPLWWKLLFVRRAPPVRRFSSDRARSARGDLAAYLTLAAVIVAIGAFKPTPPAWTPAPIAAALLAIERFNPHF